MNGRSVSKSVCSRRNKGDWCENYGDNGEEEEEEEEGET